MLCGVIAGVGNASNQYANYRIERKAQMSSKVNKDETDHSGTTSKKTITSSNGKVASECSFNEYVDYKSIAVSSLTALTFAPLSIGASKVASATFGGCKAKDAWDFTSQLIANFATGGNVSALQSCVELF